MAYVTEDSRFRNVPTLTDPDGRLVTAERVPFRYEDREDNHRITVSEGKSWEDLAERLYAHISERACGLRWILHDFQPTPIVDPTIPPRPGSVVFAPSDIVVLNEILGQPRSEYL
ncbi:MAG: hypothetical protein GTN69_01910 [Armatimonadetes bacterium]|nr:hypothetical protein [Armatimonadota bacterium]